MTYSLFFSSAVMTPPADRFTFHTVARALATKIKKTPGLTTFLARYSSAIRCLRCPALQSITGTPFAPAQALHPAGEPARQPHQVRVI